MLISTDIVKIVTDKINELVECEFKCDCGYLVSTKEGEQTMAVGALILVLDQIIKEKVG